MKKLYISCPMRGRTEANIRNSMTRMHKIAEATFGEELEVIPSFIEGAAPVSNDARIWYLGETIKKMSNADYFIGVGYERAFPGCLIEYEVAINYDIPCTTVDMPHVMPDAWAIAQGFYTEGEVK